MSEITKLLEMATEQERKVAEVVLRDLVNRRTDKMTGELNYRVLLSGGGIRDKWVETKAQVK
jgi:hypothetical protein